MHHSIRRLTSMASVLAMLSASALATAQTAAPARETPRPQDIDPAVNTSSPASDAAAASTSRSGDAATAAPAADTPTQRAAEAGPSERRGSSARSGGKATGKAAAAAEGKPRGKTAQHLELDTTQITGNRELPKVLYIVPWKRSDLGDLVGKPVNSLLDEVLTPVDRDVFRRENRYYRALTPADADSRGASAAPVSGTTPSGATSSGSAAPAARDER